MKNKKMAIVLLVFGFKQNGYSKFHEGALFPNLNVILSTSICVYNTWKCWHPCSFLVPYNNTIIIHMAFLSKANLWSIVLSFKIPFI